MDKDPVLNLWSQTLGTEQLDTLDPSQTYKFSEKATGLGDVLEPLPTLMLTEEESRGQGSALADTVCESEAKTVLQGDTVSPSSETVTVVPKSDGAPSSPSLNHYELFEEIGRGGMGVIYRAKQRSLGREVAIKKVRPVVQDREYLAKFASEARVTGELDHPNIIPVYDLGRDDRGQALLVMKLIGGMEWRSLLHPVTSEEKRRAADLELPDHLKIMITVCNALAYAHDRGVIHADLKPENIMIGQYGEVFVMDWGVAVDVREQSPAFVDPMWIEHKSTVRHPRGTPVYMPPELASGDGPQMGAWTDVYLLGAILFEILTGSPPHRAKNLTEVLKRARLAEQPDFSSEVPEELREICRKAMNRIPNDRYCSVIEFQRALEDFLEHRESIRIADRAQLILNGALEQCQQKCATGIRNYFELYSSFAEAVAGFSQAQMLWPGNLVAQSSEYQARLAYARLALKNGDFGLAEAQAGQLPDTCPTCQDLRAEIEEAMEKRRAKEEAAQRAIENERKALDEAQKMLARAFLEKAKGSQARGDVLAGRVYSARALTIDSLPEARNVLLELSQLPGAAVWQSRAGEFHEGAILDLAFDPGGAWAVTIGQDERVVHWDMSGAPKATPLEALNGQARCVVVHPHGDVFAVGYESGELKLWSVEKSQLLSAVQGHSHPIQSLDFSSLGETLGSVCRGGEFHVRSLDSEGKLKATPLIERQTDHGIVYKVLYNHCLKTWATGGEDGVIRFWKDPENPKEYPQHRGPVYDFVFTHCGQMCASAGADHQVKLWKTEDGFLLLAYEVNGARRIAFANDDFCLATASKDGLLRLWSMNSGRPTLTLRGHSGAIHSIKFCPKTGRIVSAGEDQSLRVWDWQGKNQDADKRVYASPSPTDALRFDNDFHWQSLGDQSVVSMAPFEFHRREGAAIVLALGEQSEAADWLTLNFEGTPDQVGVSHDGQKVAIRSKEGPVILWNLASLLMPSDLLFEQLQRETGLQLMDFDLVSRHPSEGSK